MYTETFTNNNMIDQMANNIDFIENIKIKLCKSNLFSVDSLWSIDKLLPSNLFISNIYKSLDIVISFGTDFNNLDYSSYIVPWLCNVVQQYFVNNDQYIKSILTSDEYSFINMGRDYHRIISLFTIERLNNSSFIIRI